MARDFTSESKLTTTMKTIFQKTILAATLVGVMAFTTINLRAQDPLPSWNDGAAKKSIVEFVTKVTKPGSPDFVPVPERIATFDNDGTLWCEQPLPVQAFFVFDRVKELAPQHPEWKTKEPFASVLKGDYKTALAGGDHAILELFMATHAGMTTDEFEKIVKGWIATAKHPKYRQALHCEMTLSADARSARLSARERVQELHRLRRRHRIHAAVGGTGLWHPAGTGRSAAASRRSLKCATASRARAPAGIEFQRRQGRQARRHQPAHRPPAHCGVRQFRGDQEMLEYTQAGSGARFELLVLHDDAAREYAYGPALKLPDVKLGAFTQALYDQAQKSGWTVVSMKNDWKQIFPFEKQSNTH
jgi:hypothetical protein